MDGGGVEFRDGTLDSEGNLNFKIDSEGNIGFLVTPENSNGTWRNLNFGSLAAAGRSDNTNPDGMVGTNFKFTTANAEQRISAHGTSRLFFDEDVFKFQNAGADSANSSIGWNTRILLIVMEKQHLLIASFFL